MAHGGCEHEEHGAHNGGGKRGGTGHDDRVEREERTGVFRSSFKPTSCMLQLTLYRHVPYHLHVVRHPQRRAPHEHARTRHGPSASLIKPSFLILLPWAEASERSARKHEVVVWRGSRTRKTLLQLWWKRSLPLALARSGACVRAPPTLPRSTVVLVSYSRVPHAACRGAATGAWCRALLHGLWYAVVGLIPPRCKIHPPHQLQSLRQHRSHLQ